MDIEDFWKGISFRFDYREKGMFIMSATVDSTGTPLQLKVVSRNREASLDKMDWIYIYGTVPKGGEAIQYFRAPYTLSANLEELQSNTPGNIVYVHKWEPYTITRHVSPSEISMSVRDEHVRLAEIITSPTFTVKKLQRLR